MVRELIYRLHDPNYTIYHRAALGGLAATVEAWGEVLPEGITTAKVERDQVRLAWGDELTDQEALRRILAASFKLTEEKLIDLPGHSLSANAIDLRLAIHNGLCLTFLQHPKMRPGEKEPRRFALRSPDNETGEILTYKAVNNYAHQKAQGTKLLDVPKKSKQHHGELPAIAVIPQSVVPGAMSGNTVLQAESKEVILLLFLMVGCSIFLLRPRTYQEKAQACIIIPDVIDLSAFARAMRYIATAGKKIERFTNSYLGRVVGGAEEAALRFLVDIHSEDIAAERSVSTCQAIAMGKVAWDKNQINRSISVRLRDDYDEISVFRAALPLGQSKLIKTKNGESYAIPGSPVPELIAANLAAEHHWCAHFKNLVSSKKDFDQMLFLNRGLNQMAQVVKDTDDRIVIQVFHQAWKLTMAGIGTRAREQKLNFNLLVEVRREKIRNEILRAKTPDALAGWFLRFCADASSGNSLGVIRENADKLQAFIFCPRYFDRFQNLLLFALISYKADEKETATKGV